MSVHPYFTRCSRAALLTCVTNCQGLGPGHTAIVIDGFVYSFEKFIGAFNVSKSSAWVQFHTKDYLEANRHRPVIIQELKPERTDATRIHDAIAASDLADTDYLSSGVCSQQAAVALSAGLKLNVNPWGMDTPHNIYRFVKSVGAVAEEYYTFPDEARYPWFGGKKLAMWVNFWDTWSRKETPPPILAWQ